jgi:hypothetical protein
MTRLLFAAPAVFAVFAVACGDAGEATGSGGAAGSGGSAVAAAGSTSSVGGSGSTAGSPPVMVTLAGSGQAIGGGDQGSLFPPDGSVPIMADTAGTSSGGTAPVIPGDGKVAKSTLGGSIQGSATFTQTGEDVRIVVDLTGGCADGNHMFRIHDGGSCDSASTEGNPWSPRGTGIGPDTGIACTGGKGKLDYTRKGDDKTKNITVGDHNPDTDVTTHVVIVSDEKDPNSRASCGNFFF